MLCNEVPGKQRAGRAQTDYVEEEGVLGAI